MASRRHLVHECSADVPHERSRALQPVPAISLESRMRDLARAARPAPNRRSWNTMTPDQNLVVIAKARARRLEVEATFAFAPPDAPFVLPGFARICPGILLKPSTYLCLEVGSVRTCRKTDRRQPNPAWASFRRLKLDSRSVDAYSGATDRSSVLFREGGRNVRHRGVQKWDGRPP